MLSFPYDRSYTWPFPVLPVIIRRLEGEFATPPVLALLDTGADVSLVPLHLLEEIQASEVFNVRLRSQWGESHPATAYIVDLEIGGEFLPSIQVVADNSCEMVLLGRNILNKFPLFLDGPKQFTDILNDATAQRLRTRRKAK